MSDRAAIPIPRLAAGIAPDSVPLLGENGGYTFSADTSDVPALPHSSPILEAIHTPFTVDGFSGARTPLVIGRAVLADLPEKISIADMPVKWPGLGYRVPVELMGLRGLLSQCAATEAAINPRADDYFAYLTLQRAVVHQGGVKRGEGAHSDSVQGPRIQPKVAIEHGYTATDRDPTRFFTHGFDLTGLDPDKDWLNTAFEAQANRSQSVRFNPGEIVLFDAYTIHEAVPAAATGMRTFVRLIYSVRQFDRLGNTVNSLFDYNWNFRPRPVPANLAGLPSNGT